MGVLALLIMGVRNKIGALALVACICLPLSTDSGKLQTRSSPEFSDFHVEQVYSGRNATPKVTAEWQSFKTRIREAASQPPNFAGAYRIVEWGCGSDCVRFVLLDLKSGSVHAPPFESLWLDAFAKYGWYGKGLEYRSDSRLLIADGCPDEKCATYYYEWTEGAFHLIRAIPRHLKK